MNNFKKMILAFIFTFAFIMPVIAESNNYDLVINQLDEQNSLNEIINNALQEGKKTIFISNGTYNLSGSIDINTDNVQIIGESKDETILVQNSSNENSINIENTNNVSISSLTFNNKSVNDSSCINIINTNNVLIDNNIFESSNNSVAIDAAGEIKSNAKEIEAQVENIELMNGLIITNNTINANETLNAINLMLQNNCTIEDNELYEGGIKVSASNTLGINRNTIDTPKDRGILVIIPSKNFVISNNTITNSKYSGIDIEINTDFVSNPHYRGQNFTIENNNINDTRYMGIELNNIEDSLVQGNIIENVDFNGMYGSIIKNVDFVNNSILGSAYSNKRGRVLDWEKDTSCAIAFDYIVENCNVRDNIIVNNDWNCSYGVHITSDNHNTFNVIEGNTFTKFFTYPVYEIDNHNTIGENDTINVWTMLNPRSGSYINDLINEFVAQGRRKFYLLEGNYTANGNVHLAYSDMILEGENKENTVIKQIDAEADTVTVENCNNTKVRNITLSNEDVGKTTVVFTNVSNSKLENSIVYGNDTSFAVYFAGPYHDKGQDMLDKVKNNDLDDGNQILDCTVYSNYYGDGVSFCGQKNGLVKGNEINGSKLVMYLCRDSVMEENHIKDSIVSGIVCSLPSKDNIIQNNIIERCQNSGIWVVPNLEHITTNTDEEFKSTGITLYNNRIEDCRYMGINCEYLEDSTIEENNISLVDVDGIYLLHSNNLNVINNTVVDSGHAIIRELKWNWDMNLLSGIFLDTDVTNCSIENNNLKNESNECVYDIRIQPSAGNEGNNVINNDCTGNFTNFFEQ